MANDFPGPYSPEQLAQIQSYYGVSDVNMSAAPPAAPLVDAGAYYNYNPEPDLPPAGPPVAPAAPIRPVGAQLSQLGNPQTAPFSGTGPAAPPREPESIVIETPPGALPAPGPTGPSAQDDREYAAFRRLQETHPPVARSGGGGGGGHANPDPYGVKGARGALLGTYDTEAEAMQHQATAEGDRAAMVGDRRAELARQQQEDAAIRAAETEEAQRGFDSHMSTLQQQVDEVRAKKVDPDRLMKTDGMALRAVVGGLLGGLYMGLNRLDHNPFLDDLNRQIDRDVAAQEKDLDNERHGVANKMTLLSQQRAAFKDNDLAKLATRSQMYEATKNAIEAEASKYDQPIVQARADQAVTALTREKDKNDLAFKTQAQQAAASAAAAQAAQTRTMQTEMRKAYGDTYEKLIASGASPSTAEAEAIRQTQNMFRGGAGAREPSAPGTGKDPIANVPKDQKSEAAKELREHSDRENAKAALTKAYAQYGQSSVLSSSERNALKATVRGIIKPHMKGANSDADLEALIEPLVPSGGATTNAAQASKLRAAKALLDAEGTTPILDQHSPGWRGPAPVQHLDLDGGKPKD